MFLTKEEEAILNGERGEGYKKAMELLVAIGDIKGADRLVSISSAHVSGVSFLTIGEPGLELLEEWADTGARVRVPTTTNPAGLDLESWRELGFSEKFAKKQRSILNAYERMGVRTSCTCTPYLADHVPRKGEHIAWAESNAVAYANSVLGAKTNRESGISALAAALVGKAPNYGLHLDENRKPTYEVKVETKLRDSFDYSIMGYHIGSNGGIPIFSGIKPSTAELKSLGAALATGGVSMFKIVSGHRGDRVSKLDKLHFGEREFRQSREKLNTADEVDIVCIGCPHCSIAEIRNVSKLKLKRETWIFTSRYNKPKLDRMKLHENIRLIYDTCMVVSPLRDIGIKSIGVNSAKAAFYSSNLSNLQVKFSSVEELIGQ